MTGPAAGPAPAAPSGEPDGPVSPPGSRAPRDRQWLLALLSAFPIVLLVLRLWYLSRQDLTVMLLLVQHVSQVGLISAMLVSLVWVLPLGVLTGRALGTLLRLSDPTAGRSWLARASARTPDWVVALAILLAAFVWQLRFLPLLLMITLMIVGLEARARYGSDRTLVRLAAVGLPLASAPLVLAAVGPAAVRALAQGEPVTALVLVLPPLLAVLLTGPVPARWARRVTLWPAQLAALVGPLVLAAIFLQTPILPTVAMELDARALSPGRVDPAGSGTGGVGSGAGRANGAPDGGIDDDPDRFVRVRSGEPELTVVRGQVVTTDDATTGLLEEPGVVRFVPTDAIVSTTLCPDPAQIPFSRVDLAGVNVERTLLDVAAPSPPELPADPRCQGRPLTPARD